MREGLLKKKLTYLFTTLHTHTPRKDEPTHTHFDRWGAEQRFVSCPKMEPNCAICNGPAFRRCPCEHERLIMAVEQSEQRVLQPMWEEIR